MTDQIRGTASLGGTHVITVERWVILKQQYSARTRAARAISAEYDYLADSIWMIAAWVRRCSPSLARMLET